MMYYFVKNYNIDNNFDKSMYYYQKRLGIKQPIEIESKIYLSAKKKNDTIILNKKKNNKNISLKISGKNNNNITNKEDRKNSVFPYINKINKTHLKGNSHYIKLVNKFKLIKDNKDLTINSDLSTIQRRYSSIIRDNHCINKNKSLVTINKNKYESKISYSLNNNNTFINHCNNTCNKKLNLNFSLNKNILHNVINKKSKKTRKIKITDTNIINNSNCLSNTLKQNNNLKYCEFKDSDYKYIDISYKNEYCPKILCKNSNTNYVISAYKKNNLENLLNFKNYNKDDNNINNNNLKLNKINVFLKDNKNEIFIDKNLRKKQINYNIYS